MFPKMKDSALTVIIAGEPDPKLCLELGAAILFDKPLIVAVPRGSKVSSNLKRVASAIVELDMNDPSSQDKLQQALTQVLAKDKRCRQ